ncbi:MAG: hypothetical protein IPO92_13670 [Saprospiraceae bacterium]|nr:hypothetical protein [Saprospiraceae bacterium]
MTGGWHSEFISPQKPKAILQGTYTGLIVLIHDGEWKFSHRVEGYNDPVKKFVIDKDTNIWVVGPNIGLLKLRADKDFKK